MSRRSGELIISSDLFPSKTATHHLLESIERSGPIFRPLVQTSSIRVKVDRQCLQLDQLVCQLTITARITTDLVNTF